MPPTLDVPGILERFGGVARLFPLPSVVVYPDALVPLKVFEPRYVALVEEALEDDRLIGMALLKGRSEPPAEPGDDEPPPAEPALHPVVCLGRILQHKRLDNGHFDLWLYGIERARIEEELPSAPFRRARVRLLPDRVADAAHDAVALKVRRALELVPGRRGVVFEMRRLAGQLRGVDASAGRLADAVANVCDLSPRERYAVLAEADVGRRLTRLIRLLEERADADAPTRLHPRDVLRN